MRNFDKEFKSAARVAKVTALVYLGVILFVITCWVWNLVTLVNLDFEAPYKAEIVHGVGLVPVISCVTVFLDIPDGGNG
jgi:hypothetical protein